MKMLLALFLLVFSASVSFAAPVEFRELRLLVQGRVPEAEITADIKRRKLSRPLTPDELGQLQASGAGPGLLALLASPAAQMDSEQASVYQAEKDRAAEKARTAEQTLGAESAKLNSSAKMWVLGQIAQRGNHGDAFVASNNLCRTQPPAQAPRPDDFVHFSEIPPTFKINGNNGDFINCMAVVVGYIPVMRDGKAQKVQEMKMVESLPPGALPYGAPKTQEQQPAAQQAPANRPPVTKRATLASGEWLTLANFGGPNVQMKIHNIQMSFLQVQIEKKGQIQEIKIDPQGRTLIFDDGHGCKTFHIYDPTTPGGSGVFEFVHAPDSASYPKS